MTVDIEKKSDWVFVTLPGRVDAFNFERVKQDMEEVLKASKKLALDFSGAQFVSFPMIRYIHEKAALMRGQNNGQIILLSASEKIKRQFRIYASLDPIETYSRRSEMPL